MNKLADDNIEVPDPRTGGVAMTANQIAVRVSTTVAPPQTSMAAALAAAAASYKEGKGA